MKKRATIAILGLAAGLHTESARAQSERQPWLGDRRVGEGLGIRTGNFELHPGVAGELGYDSNFFQSAGKVTAPGEVVVIPPEFRPVRRDGTVFGGTGTFSEPQVPVFRFRVTPSISLETLGGRRLEGGSPAAASPKVNFKATAAASYNELVANDALYADDVAEKRFISGDLTLAADIYPNRPWGLNLNGQYNRSVQPVNDPAAPPGFQRSTLRAGGAIVWRPGGGLLEWSLGYDFAYVLFEDEEFSTFNTVTNNVALRGRWLFLPRTSLIYVGEYGALVYPNGGSIKPPGAPLSSLLGINGLVTNHLGASVMAGYKTIFFSRDDEFESIVGSVELTWYPLPRPELSAESAGVGLSSVGVGYRRGAQASYIGNYVQSDSGFVRANYFVAGVLLLSADAALDHLRRPSSYFSNGTRQSAPFTENRVSVTGFAEYRTHDTFGINTTLRYTGAITEQQIPVENDAFNPRLPYDDFSFRRVEVWLGVRWFL